MRKSLRIFTVILALAVLPLAHVAGETPTAVDERVEAPGIVEPLLSPPPRAQTEAAPAEPSLSDIFSDRAKPSPASVGNGCFYACYDLETSEKTFGCPPGHNFAIEATGPHFACCFTSGASGCISSGCDVPASNCVGFAASCGGSCG